MTSKQPSDMSASVRARLMNIAKLNSEAFDLVLVRFPGGEDVAVYQRSISVHQRSRIFDRRSVSLRR